TVDATGPTVIASSFEYDSRGNVTRFIDPRTNDWLFTYNSLDQCVRAQTPVNISSRCATDFYYDANDNLVQCAVEVRDQTDAKLTTFLGVKVFDPLDRCLSSSLQVSDTHWVSNRFDYDGNGNLATIYSPEAVNGNDPHNIVSLQYDERNLLFRSVCAAGTSVCATNEFAYDACEQA